MSFTFTMPAPEGSRFAPTAFVAQIGKDIPLRFESELGTSVMTGTVLSVVVSSDGLFAEFTVQPDGEPVIVHDCPRCDRPMSEHTGDECPPPL